MRSKLTGYTLTETKGEILSRMTCDDSGEEYKNKELFKDFLLLMTKSNYRNNKLIIKRKIANGEIQEVRKR